MTDPEEFKEDIAYGRAMADRSDTNHVPSIYFLWAALGLCGFALIDFVDDVRWIGRYWIVAGPVGFCLSMWLGRRASHHIGQADRQEGMRWALHFLAFMVAGLLGGALVAAGQLTGPGFNSLWVLLLALTYFQAGVHLDRRLLPIGLLLGASYLATLWVTEYAWTAAGVAVALTAQALLGARPRESAS